MYNETISYEEAGTTTDIDTLYEYCVQGVEDNNHVNGGKVSDWRFASDITEVYLDHNKNIDFETMLAIEEKLEKYMEQNA
jgi:hypothetical protein